MKEKVQAMKIPKHKYGAKGYSFPLPYFLTAFIITITIAALIIIKTVIITIQRVITLNRIDTITKTITTIINIETIIITAAITAMITPKKIIMII